MKPPAELEARGHALVDQLDAEGWSNEEQIPILAGVLVACLMTLPLDLRLRTIGAHLCALGAVVGEPK
jgi:hypothetical protein